MAKKTRPARSTTTRRTPRRRKPSDGLDALGPDLRKAAESILASGGFPGLRVTGITFGAARSRTRAAPVTETVAAPPPEPRGMCWRCRDLPGGGRRCGFEPC